MLTPRDGDIIAEKAGSAAPARSETPMEARLLLIRHGHIDIGTPPRLCGSLDLPLSPLGREAVAALRAMCRCTGAPQALYTSPLLRARDTAAVLGDAWRLDVRVVDALAEIHCGRLEGMRIRDIVRDYPSLWARNGAQADDDFAWPDGESYRAFRTRVMDALREIALRHAGAAVAVVTHAGVVAQVSGIVNRRPAAVWEIDRPDPLSLTEVVFRDGVPRAFLTFNRRDWC